MEPVLDGELGMDLTTVDPIWWIVLGVVLVLLTGLLIWSRRRKTGRSERL